MAPSGVNARQQIADQDEGHHHEGRAVGRAHGRFALRDQQIEVHRQRHGGLEHRVRHRGVGDRPREDERRGRAHGIAAAEDNARDELAPALRQHEPCDGIALRAAQRVGRAQHLRRDLAKGLLSPHLDKGQDHDAERCAGGEHASPEPEVTHKKAVGKKAQHDRRDTRDTLDDKADGPRRSAPPAVKDEVQRRRDGGDRPDHDGDARKIQASDDGGPYPALRAQHRAARRLRKKLPTDGGAALPENIAEQERDRAEHERDPRAGPYFDEQRAKAFLSHLPPSSRRSRRSRKSVMPTLMIKSSTISTRPAAYSA